MPPFGKLQNPAPLGKLGALLLASDLTLESELHQMLPKGIGSFADMITNRGLENRRDFYFCQPSTIKPSPQVFDCWI